MPLSHAICKQCISAQAPASNAEHVPSLIENLLIQFPWQSLNILNKPPPARFSFPLRHPSVLSLPSLLVGESSQPTW